jgi:hypothetical protein
MLRGDEDWTVLSTTLTWPAEMKDPSRWPAQLCEELGGDVGARRRVREVNLVARAENQRPENRT